jgi:hypothetical protein
MYSQGDCTSCDDGCCETVLSGGGWGVGRSSRGNERSGCPAAGRGVAGMAGRRLGGAGAGALAWRVGRAGGRGPADARMVRADRGRRF